MNSVVYQIYPKSFCDTNDDGIGDIKGITSKLNYIASLGVDTIWLCPVFCSPMVDNGYDISDYSNIDPMFGTIDDMKELIAKAKQKGIGILLDLVLNHTSNMHPWFQSAIQDAKSPFRNFYIFKDAINGLPPNNWRSNFGGSVWEKAGDSYYFHTFAKEQPDLNWENPNMRQALYEMICTWLDMGVAGFRIDAISFIKKNPLFPNLEPEYPDGLASPNEHWLVHDGIGEFLSELRDRCFKPYNAYTVAEANGLNKQSLAEFIGENGYFSAAFDFSYTDIDLKNGNWHTLQNIDRNVLKSAIFECQASVSKIGHGAVYLENHDQNRSPNKYLSAQEISCQSIKMLGAMYFFLQGTAYIYQGQELGLLNYPWQSLAQFNDVSTLDQYERAICVNFTKDDAFKIVAHRSRDNARIPMPWQNIKGGGFTKCDSAWLPLYDNIAGNTVQEQEASVQSVLSFYKEMCALRRGKLQKLFFDGKFAPFLETQEGIFAYQRILDDIAVTVICNFKNSIDIVSVDSGTVILSNMGRKHEKTNSIITLSPFEAILILSENCNEF